MNITTDVIKIIDSSAQLYCRRMTFDYVDVLNYSTKPDISSFKKILWCLTRSTTPDDISWYGTVFDREKHLMQYGQKHTVLTDKYLVGIKSQIVVKDVFEFLKKVHQWVLDQVSVQVVGVTGSVGKTTSVCMIEDVFSNHGKTLRIYAKRITPLSLFEIIINQLTTEYKYVVMEYSMYHKHHIPALVELLRPDVGIILNINTAHLGIDGINSFDDIWNSKIELLLGSKHRFAEKSCLNHLTEKACGVENVTYFEWSDYLDSQIFNEKVDPFIKSRLTYVQIGASLLAIEQLVKHTSTSDRLTAYMSKPRENRLSKISAPQGKEVFFDGEVTNASRLFAYGDTLYEKKILILRDVEFFE